MAHKGDWDAVQKYAGKVTATKTGALQVKSVTFEKPQMRLGKKLSRPSLDRSGGKD